VKKSARYQLSFAIKTLIACEHASSFHLFRSAVAKEYTVIVRVSLMKAKRSNQDPIAPLEAKWTKNVHEKDGRINW
jgi:hypothetical protein